MNVRITITSLLLCGSILTGCEKATSPQPSEMAKTTLTMEHTQPLAIDSEALYRNIWQQGDASLQQAVQSAQALLQSIETFIGQTNQSHWQALQQQWLNSHQHWHQADSYLQWLAPNYDVSQLRLRIHSQEVTPGYLDSIEGYPQSGIVNDSTLAINQQNLQAQHRRYSDEETALGIHVLEFFIWGRMLADYIQSQDPAIAKAITRRRQYLKLLGHQWLVDIKTAQAFWQQREEQLLAPAALKLTMQQQLGALVGNEHCQFSQDQGWRRAVINSIGQHINADPSLNQLQQLSDQRGSELPDNFRQHIGQLMLALQLKAS